MTAKKNQGSGRVTPKGTKNPIKVSKRTHRDDTAADAAPTGFQAGKAGRQNSHIARPISHNRGNR